MNISGESIQALSYAIVILMVFLYLGGIAPADDAIVLIGLMIANISLFGGAR